MEKQIKVVLYMSTTLRHIYVFGKQKMTCKVQEQATSKDSGAIYIWWGQLWDRQYSLFEHSGMTTSWRHQYIHIKKVLSLKYKLLENITPLLSLSTTDTPVVGLFQIPWYLSTLDTKVPFTLSTLSSGRLTSAYMWRHSSDHICEGGCQSAANPVICWILESGWSSLRL